MIGKSSHKILKLYVAQLQAELHLLKVKKLDACIRPLFANPVTNFDEERRHRGQRPTEITDNYHGSMYAFIDY